MFEKNQEDESSSSSTSSQTTQGGTTGTGIASKTKGTSQTLLSCQ